jgi:hypothetical protein
LNITFSATNTASKSLTPQKTNTTYDYTISAQEKSITSLKNGKTKQKTKQKKSKKFVERRKPLLCKENLNQRRSWRR